MKTLEVKRAWRESARVPFGLGQHFLRPERALLGLDDAQYLVAHAESVVGGSGLGRIFLDGAVLVCAQRAVGLEGAKFQPAARSF